MNYLYNVTESGGEFHKRRTAFIIADDEVEFLPKESQMSHWEFCNQKGMTKEELEAICMGYYIDGDVCFYKGNMVYDDFVIKEGLKHLKEIKDYVGATNVKIYFGQIIPRENEEWKYDYYYGDMNGDEIVKIEKL